MITACEMRKIADKVNADNIAQHLKRITDLIEIAANVGWGSIETVVKSDTSIVVLDGIKKELIEAGFKVETHYGRTSFTISW